MNFNEFELKHLKMLEGEIAEKIRQGEDMEELPNIIHNSTLIDVFIVLKDYHNTFIQPLIDATPDSK